MSSTERQTIAHGKYEKNSNTALKGLKLWLKFYNIIIAYLETFFNGCLLYFVLQTNSL